MFPWMALADATTSTSGAAVGVGSGGRGRGGEQCDNASPRVVGVQTAATVAVAILVAVDRRDPTSIVVIYRGGPELNEKFGRHPYTETKSCRNGNPIKYRYSTRWTTFARSDSGNLQARPHQ